MRGIFLSTVGTVALITGIVSGETSWAQDSSGSGIAAQTTTAPTTAAIQGIAVYDIAFFADQAPVTALDMVQRVPGFSISEGDTNRRGLGDSFGNVLVDGTRPANKSLSLFTVLQRIPTENVERIELVQEALPDYEMRGHSRLVNVIMKEGTGNSGSWDGAIFMSSSGRMGSSANISYTTSAGPFEITFGLGSENANNRFVGRRSRLDGNETLTEIQHDNDSRHFENLTPSLALNWTIDDKSSLRVNLQSEVWEWRRENISFIDEPVGNGFSPLQIEHSQTDDDGSSYRASMTYQREINEKFSLETMALFDRSFGDFGPDIFQIFDPALGFQEAFIVVSGADREETALRQTVSYDPNDNHSLEFGVEIAVNALDSSLALSFDDGNSVTSIDLPVANTRVEETRSEIFANHVWTINDRLSLESGLRYESSEIEQTGDVIQSRTFSYPKPNFTLNWRQDDDNRLRLTARRDVAQLQFRKFASSVDVSEDNSVIGNPDYVPQRTWTLEGEWERRLSEENSFSLEIGYDWIEDLDGFIAIITPTGAFDAPGNIGDGTQFRIAGNVTTTLDNWGLSNSVLNASLGWRDTQITDPLTGNDRRFDGVPEWRLDLDYRQTFPVSQMAWGWDYHWVSDGEVFRAAEQRTFGGSDGDLDLYVETTRWLGVTTRLGVNEVINNGRDRERIFFDGSRADGIVSAVENRNINRGATWYLQMRGTF